VTWPMDRRGSVAMMAGIMAPVMVMTMAMGIEVTDWSVKNLELQRVADAAALAGAQQYVVNSNAQVATGTASDVAEMNGATGQASRGWNATTLTTTDNLITAQIITGITKTTDKAVKVTITQNIVKSFSLIFSATPTVTISAVAIAEIGGAGPQPCLLALSPSGAGVDDVTLTGSASVTATGCSVRSNSGISFSGVTTITAGGTYAAGGITLGTNGVINGGSFQNQGVITDPYAGNATLATAFSALASNTVTFADPNPSYQTITINPGTYPTLTLGGSATVTMNPGTYYVQGAVVFNGNVSVTGTGVTIISSSTFNVDASAHGSLAAPLSGATVGIPGILFASKAVSTTNQSTWSSFQGAGNIPFTGLIYFPNGTMGFEGSATNSSAGCSEVIAADISVSGASDLGANCAAYGTVGYGSLPSSVVLVE
jgi:Flp pilus assembly protein TadG